MNTTNSKRWLPRRNTVITGAAIGAVVLAGAAAVGLNLGILNAADDDKVGDLAAAGDLVPVETQVVDVYIDAPSATAVDGANPDDTQQFVVDVAGTASVISTSHGLELGDAAANPGWSWSLVNADASMLKLSFADGARTLVFTATLDPDGSLGAIVEESAPIGVAGNPAIGSDDDDGGGGGDDDDHEGEDEDHEGRDDDD